MDATAISQGAMASQQYGALAKPVATADVAKAAKAAKEYEGIFIAQFMGSMFEGISTDGPMGGGQGEAMFRSMMIDQYAQGVVKQGGFGLATQMQAELLKHQQATQ